MPAHGTAALEAMTACRRLREVVVLPEDVLSRLEDAYEQSAIVVLQAVAGMLNGHLKSALTPTSLLACIRDTSVFLSEEARSSSKCS